MTWRGSSLKEVEEVRFAAANSDQRALAASTASLRLRALRHTVSAFRLDLLLVFFAYSVRRAMIASSSSL